MREEETKQIATGILKRKGFTNIRWIGKPYDIEAEKNGVKYAIEVKGSDISFTTSWHQLRQMYSRHFHLKDHRILLIFVTEESWYCIFEMTDALMI